jgi:hypothetical protein
VLIETCSYTRDGLLFNYDYKKDLQKTAVERDRIFIIKKVREDTEESDDEGYFEKDVEEAEIEDEKPTATSGKVTKKKGVQLTPVPVAIEEEE